MDAATVEQKYVELGYGLGWFFLLTPAAAMKTSKVVTVGLNPGGDKPETSAWDYPGNAYIDADWTHGEGPTSIQRQMAAMYELLGVKPTEVMAGQFIPFRSPTWASLDKQKEAIAFAKELWTWTLSQSPAKLIICLGHEVTRHIVKITSGTRHQSVPTGWGETQFVQYVDPQGRIIIDVPHLSRYAVFGRANGHSETAKQGFRSLVKSGLEREADSAC